MYRNSTLQNAKLGLKLKVERETKKSSKSNDPYACAIKIKHQFFDTWLTVGHILCHFNFLMREDGNSTGYMVSATYKGSPIPSVV